jgi:hypothetical protein
LNDATDFVAKDILSNAYGRPLTDTEKEIQTERTKDAITIGEGIQKGAIALGSGRALGMAKGIVTGTIFGAAEGALTGALLAEEEGTAEDRSGARVQDATFGALLGAPIGAITGAFATVRNMAVKQVVGARRGADEALELADDFDVSLSAGQATGSPTVQAFEQGAASDNAQRFFAAQANSFAQRISARLGVALPTIRNVGAELPGRLRAAFGILDDAVGDMAQLRQSAWVKAGKQAEAVGGGRRIMPVNRLQGSIQNAIEQMDTLFGDAIRPGVTLKRLQKEVADAAANGGAKAEDINKWWLQINTMADSPTGSGMVRVSKSAGDFRGTTLETLAGSMRRNLVRQIDEAGDTNALNMLKAQRKNWQEGTDMIRGLTDDVLGQLGLRAGNPDQVLASLETIDVNAMQGAMDFIRRRSGGTRAIREIQGALFEATVKKGQAAAVGGAKQAGDFDIKGFVNALASTTHRSRLAGVFTPAQEATARRGIDLARTILNEGAVGGRVMHKIVAGAENIAINVMSRDPGFMARLLAGALVRGKGADWLFYSDEGLEMLRTLSPSYLQFGKTAAARNASIAFLIGTLGDGAKNQTQESPNAASVESQQ